MSVDAIEALRQRMSGALSAHPRGIEGRWALTDCARGWVGTNFLPVTSEMSQWYRSGSDIVPDSITGILRMGSLPTDLSATDLRRFIDFGHMIMTLDRGIPDPMEAISRLVGHKQVTDGMCATFYPVLCYDEAYWVLKFTDDALSLPSLWRSIDDQVSSRFGFSVTSSTYHQETSRILLKILRYYTALIILHFLHSDSK